MGQACASCNCNKEEKDSEVVTLGGNKRAKGKGHEYMNQEHTEETSGNAEDSDGQPLEYKEEHKFANGAIY